jgi:hypothetical protein
MIIYGQLTSIAGGDNLAIANVRGQLRPVFLNPTRFVLPWFVPVVGDWLALGPGAHDQWHVLAVLGRGVSVAEPPA